MTGQSILFEKILTKKMDPRVKPAGDDRLEGRVEITTVGLRRRAAPMLAFALAGFGSGQKSVLRAGETRHEVRHLPLHLLAPRHPPPHLRAPPPLPPAAPRPPLF